MDKASKGKGEVREAEGHVDPLLGRRRLVDVRCGFAERARLQADAAEARLRETKARHEAALHAVIQAETMVEPDALAAAKEAAHRAFRKADRLAGTRQDVEKAATFWLAQINRINTSTRAARRQIEHLHDQAAMLEVEVAKEERSAAAARATADMAMEACLEARQALAEGEKAAAEAARADAAWEATMTVARSVPPIPMIPPAPAAPPLAPAAAPTAADESNVASAAAARHGTHHAAPQPAAAALPAPATHAEAPRHATASRAARHTAEIAAQAAGYVPVPAPATTPGPAPEQPPAAQVAAPRPQEPPAPPPAPPVQMPPQDAQSRRGERWKPQPIADRLQSVAAEAARSVVAGRAAAEAYEAQQAAIAREAAAKEAAARAAAEKAAAERAAAERAAAISAALAIEAERAAMARAAAVREAEARAATRQADGVSAAAAGGGSDAGTTAAAETAALSPLEADLAATLSSTVAAATTAAPPTEVPGLAPTPSPTPWTSAAPVPTDGTFNHEQRVLVLGDEEPAAVLRLLERDRSTLERLVAELAAGDEAMRYRWKMLLSDLADGIVAAAIDQGYFIFPETDPFWGMFNNDQCRDIARGLAALGYRYDGMGGFADERCPGHRELSLALGHAGLNPVRIRRWPSREEAAGLFRLARVAADEFLVERAPALTLGELVRLLNRRAEQLADLWNDWERVRPLLLSH